LWTLRQFFSGQSCPAFRRQIVVALQQCDRKCFARGSFFVHSFFQEYPSEFLGKMNFLKLFRKIQIFHKHFLRKIFRGIFP
jgi:hypothetical protein